jgi:hypothetical protein
MAISVATTNETITAAVTDEQVTATVSPAEAVSATVTAGFGATGPAGNAATVAIGTVTTGTPASVTNAGSSSEAVLDFVIPAGEVGQTGPSGVISVSSPLTNTGSSTAATIGLSFGSGLGVINGTLIVFGVPQSSISGLSDTLLFKANSTHAHGSITSDGKIGTTSGRIVVTTVNGSVTTAASISTSQITGLGTLATQSGTFSGTSSGTNTGDQTITLTGDVTGSGTGSFAATLASTGVSAASYGSASSVATFTVDAKGRLTTAGSASIAIAASAVTSGTFDAARIPTIAYSSLSGLPTLGTAAAASTTDFAAASHSHAASEITSGTIDVSRLPVGTGSTQVAAGNDSRFSDSRTPTAHTHPLSDLSQSGATTNQVPQWSGSAWVPATVSGGGGSSSASDLTSGTLADARLSDKSQSAMNVYLWSNFR